MSEIEKMYENAGVKLKYSGWLDMGDLDTQMTHIQCDTKEEWDECVFMSRSSYSSDDENYDKPKMEYPTFTAEKQIELIKWLAMHKSSYGLQYFGKQWANCCEFEWENFEECSEDVDFEQSLSGLINIIWQSLTEEEKQQVKEILE